MKKYPKGTVFGAWCTYIERQKGKMTPVIKRWLSLPNAKRVCERMPTAKYAHFRHDPKELEKFLIRQNEELRKEHAIRAGVELRHAYINEELIGRYRKLRDLEVPSRERVSTELYYLQKYFLSFFINHKNLKDPKDWYRCHKTDWADYLLNHKEVPSAPATKREIIQAANRFIAWLHMERPTEVLEWKFKPISKERFKDLVARREIDPDVKHRKNIPDKEWWEILKNLVPELRPFVLLAYHYGVRRGEALGFLPGDVKKGYLSVERQLEHLLPEVKFKPTKGKMKRSVPHWYAEAATAYSWVEATQKLRIDPDDLTTLWKELMTTLNMTYDFHDLRHTFITKAARDKHHMDVMLAAGHKHLKTTLGYVHDDRDLKDDIFIPDEAS